MRTFTFIFALYLFGIAITPAFAMLACNEEEAMCTEMSSCEESSQSCETDEGTCGTEDQKEDCANTCCPFICCTSCLFCFVEPENATYIQSPVSILKLKEADQNTLIGYTSDSWQPPEFC